MILVRKILTIMNLKLKDCFDIFDILDNVNTEPVACLVGGLGGQLTLRSFELVIDWPLKIKNPKPILPQPTITNVENSSSGEKDYVLNNGPLLINPNNSTAVISTNVDENGNNDFESTSVQPDTNKKSLDIVFSFLIDKCQDFPSDPYLFKNITLSKALIRALIEVGPCQPGIEKKFKFPKNEKGNCFNPDWYDIKSRSGFHFKRNWLVFSPKSNKMYCFYCFLFRTLSKHNSNWSDPAEGVNNFRKGLEKIIKHETSKKSEKEHNRNVLKRLIDVSLFLAKNGLPFRGHKEKLNDGKSNNGLFLELVKLIAKYDAVLCKHLLESKRNQTYLSNLIQNDIIEAMAQETLQLILKEVKIAKYFSIIIDSTIDISRDDQFSLSIRFVDQGGIIREHFLCFEELPGASADNFFDVLKKCLKKFDLDFSMCRGQSYDGASTMSGRYSGLQSKVKELSPLSLYIHCCAHNLNLVLIDSIKSSIDAVSFFGTLESLYTFLTSSLPRLHILEEEQKKQVEGIVLTLKKLSETRWASHKRAVDAVYFSLPAIVKTLKKISKGEIPNTKQKTVSEAQDKVYILSNYLQNSSINLLTAHSMIQACFTDIDSMRTIEVFMEVKEKAIVFCNGFDGRKQFDEPRYKKIKTNFGESTEVQSISSVDERFRINTYFVILDAFTNVLKYRFEDFSSIVRKFEILDPKKSFEGRPSNEILVEPLIELSTFYQIDK
ncbi:zinc finger MYM-type protein 1-like [Melanaphis sacchari]|uniref:zinc finger MYM-type protein 1-like n=1 Tax=Melanaphis sacchari TaxID=742174 RepID=UPI000DC131C4|nr:zinc finger MYM-type protein 1-like [Melanaphis sacchari]